MRIRADAPPSMLLIAPCTPWDPVKRNMPSPPIGLWRIKGYIQERIKATIEIYDPWYSDKKIEEICESRPWTVIGISALNDSLPQDLKNINIAKRYNAKALVLAGGIEATTNYQTILDHSLADGVILGYGEKALLRILFDESLPVPGMVIRTYAEEIGIDDFDNFWEDYPLQSIPFDVYWQRAKEIRKDANFAGAFRIVDVSHCNRRCTFCSISALGAIASGKECLPVRMVSPEHVIALVHKAVHTIPELKVVYSVSDDFLTDWDRAIKILSSVATHSDTTHLKWLIQSSLPRITRDRIQELSRYNVTHLTLGLESFIPRVLKLIYKHQNPDEIYDIVEWCKEFGIDPYILVILFFPMLTYEELEQTYKGLRKLQDMGASISIEPYVRPYPKTFISLQHAGKVQMDLHTDYLGNSYRINRTLVPENPEVQEIFLAFQKQYDAYMSVSEEHLFKGNISGEIIDILGRCL
jgi:radical SAM superfamily enzyme YgiQ (UPF0313 family)